MKKGLNIAFFGSSLVSAYWNGAATYYRGLVRALHDRGHRVTFYEPNAYKRQENRDMPDPDWAKVVVYSGVNEAEALSAVESARGADLILKASGVGVFDELLERAVLPLRRPGTLVAYLDVDAPATLERIHNNRSDPFCALIPEYDMVLTYGGGKPVVDAYLAAGARECVPIYNALDPHTHFRSRQNPRFRSDVTFLGNRMPDREERVQEFFFKPASALPAFSFLLGGNGWEDKPLGSNVKRIGHVFTRDHNALNSSALTVLNINRGSMARYGFSPPTRVFEAAGAGACLITDKWDGIELFLQPGEEVLVAKDGEEVCEVLRNLSPMRAREIGRKGMKRIKAEHTYAHRADQVEKVLEGRFSKPINSPEVNVEISV